MARLLTAGAELGHPQAEGMTQSGPPVVDTAVKRTGLASYRCGSSSYVLPSWTGVLDRAYYIRTYFQISAYPTASSAVVLDVRSGAGTIYTVNISPGTPSGTPPSLVLPDGGSIVFARPEPLLAASVWYCLEAMVSVATSGGAFTWALRLNGVILGSGVRGAGNTAPTQVRIGNSTAPGGSINVYVDDMAVNDDQGASQNSWPGDGAVYALIPASDPGTGTNNANWTKPSGGTSTRNTSVDNNPPIFLADSTAGADDEKMLRNPTNASSQLELTMQSYDAAGVPASGEIELVQPVAGTGSASATDTTGSIESTANPVVSARTLTTFDNGIASTTTTTWPRASGNVVYRPTVTRGTGPTIRLTRDASAQVVMTDMVAMLVEVSPTSKSENDGTAATVRHGWF